MMNRLFIGLWFVSCFTLFGCRENRKQEEQRYTWSSEAPLTIPYRTRVQRFVRGNVVRNPSFETGRTFMLSSSASSYVMDGWQQIGQHVQWVDTRTNSLFNTSEACSGYRAVKIVRKNAYETDEQGDGILSEFIKVIPGNYTLSFFTRLENIIPPKARLGVKMYDAITVQLLYFDKNKLAISPNQKFPGRDQFINTSFKSLSLANYNRISSLGWSKIIGKSEHFPFPDGDIPSEAHYVKIFIGLKGTGTMWIDSVSFTYSERNFSVNERMHSLTDTSVSLTEAIVPAPKNYRRLESVLFQSTDMTIDELPLIILPSGSDLLLEKAAGLLRDALGITGDRVIREAGKAKIEASRLVFSLGETFLYRDFREFLPEESIRQHPQGYFIHSPSAMPKLVFLGGNNNSSDAIYYAVMTVLQMIDRKQPVFHNARIVDYPDFIYRYCALEDQSDLSKDQQDSLTGDLTCYKLNGAFFADRGQQPTFLQAPFERLFSYKNIPAYRPPADSVAQPAFHNQLLDYYAFDKGGIAEIQVDKHFYSGCSYYSIRTDGADIDRFIACTGTRPVFMDNSMQMSAFYGNYTGKDPIEAGKIRLYNLFEPYGNADIKTHFTRLDTTTFFVNLAAGSEIDLIRLATAADFMWNTSTYAADRSLWRVLLSRYGAGASRVLLLYADQYSFMLEMLFRLKTTNQVPRNLKNEQQALAKLNALTAETAEILGANHRLVKEITELNRRLKAEMIELGLSSKLDK